MMKKRSSILLLMVSLAFMFMILSVYASEDCYALNKDDSSAFTDMPNDWSKTALENAVNNGLLSGYDGKVMPNDNLTRAQMAAIVNRAFGAVNKANISAFTDVSKTNWFFNDMAKAVQMGTFKGSNNKLYPNQAISREEAFVVLARAFKLSNGNITTLNQFSDKAQISSWAASEIAALVQAGYISGANGKLNPKQYITRAEFAKIMDNLVKQYKNAEGTYTENVTGSLMINVPNVTLKNMTITGDLIIGDGVGDGDVTLENVSVKGRTVIRGGGANSIKITGNSSIGTIIVARIDGVVSVKLLGDAKVDVVFIDDGSDDVILVGALGEIQLDADDVTVTALDAKVNKIEIAGDDSKVIVGAGSNISNIGISGKNANVSGLGKVANVQVLDGGDNATITTPSTKISVAEGVKEVTGGGGEELTAGSTASNNSNGTALAKDKKKSSGSTSFSITVNAGGDAYINGDEATDTAAISVIPTGATIASVSIEGINRTTEAQLTVTATLNALTGKYEFDATLFKDGILTVTATDAAAVESEGTLTLDTGAARLITGGVLVELTGEDNLLSLVQVYSWAFPASGDLNGDGRLDVIVGDMAGHIDTFYQQTNGSYLVAETNPLGAIATAMYTFPGLGDLDGDGDLDLVVSLQTGYVQYYLNTGTATNPVFTLQEGVANPFAAVYNPLYAFNAVGDVDADGDVDVLFGYGDDSPSQVLELWENNGSGAFTKHVGDYAPFTNYSVANSDSFVVPYLGDFNGDSKLDFGVYTSRLSNAIAFYQGDGAGVYTLNTTQNPFDGISVDVPFASAGDIDGDGDADFLIGDNGGMVRTFQNNVGEAVILSSSQITAGLGSGNVTTNATSSLALSGKGAEGLAAISIYVDGNLLTNSVRANALGEWQYTWLGTEDGFAITNGESYAITVKQTDVAGNVSVISDSYTINVQLDD